MSTENTEKQNEKLNDFFYPEESFIIRGAIFEVYKNLGPGFLESVYKECLEMEFEQKKIPYKSQVLLDIEYKGKKINQNYIADFICFEKILIELKSAKELSGIHKSQLLNYLKATKMKLGFFLNFGSFPKVEIERIVL